MKTHNNDNADIDLSFVEFGSVCILGCFETTIFMSFSVAFSCNTTDSSFQWFLNFFSTVIQIVSCSKKYFNVKCPQKF